MVGSRTVIRSETMASDPGGDQRGCGPGVVLKDRYEIVSELGRGGFGTTWKARDRGSGRPVALEELRLWQRNDWKALELFRREAETLKRLDHPAIPRYVDYFEVLRPRSHLIASDRSRTRSRQLPKRPSDSIPTGVPRCDEIGLDSAMLTVDIRNISAQGLEYREFEPDPSLAQDVEYLWTLRARAPLASPLTQMSAGKSSLDLIVPLAGNFCAHAERHLFGDRELGAYLVGPLSAPRPIVSEGCCTAAGARFRPGRAQAFFRVSMHELTDRVLPVASLSAPLERRLSGAAHDTSADVGQVQALQQLLCEARAPRADEVVLAAVRLIEQHRGDIRVDHIANAVGVGVRKLERRFREVVGIGPKLACRIARVRYAMALLPRRAGVSWADFAFSCGFYDQAHFIREFRFVAGMTPTAFTGGYTSVSHSYNTGGVPGARVS